MDIPTALRPTCWPEIFILWIAIFHIDLSSFFSLSLTLSLPRWDCGTTDLCCIGHSQQFMPEVWKVIDLELVTHIGKDSVP